MTRVWLGVKRAVQRELDYLSQLPKESMYRALARQPIIEGYSRIYFFHIRKTGGTSLNHMFLSLGGEQGKTMQYKLGRARSHRLVSGKLVYVSHNKKLIQRGHYHYAFSHYSQHKLTLPSETFTLTCLRDPARRVISHYKMISEYPAKNPNSKKHSKTFEGTWLGSSFEDFLSNIPKLHLLRQLSMFSKRYVVEEAYDNIMNLSHYFFLENYPSEVLGLSKQLKLDLQPVHANRTSTKVDINEHEMDRLRSMLEPEYLLIDKLRKSKAGGVVKP